MGEAELPEDGVGDTTLGVGGVTEVESLLTELGEDGGVTWSGHGNHLVSNLIIEQYIARARLCPLSIQRTFDHDQPCRLHLLETGIVREMVEEEDVGEEGEWVMLMLMGRLNVGSVLDEL